MINDWKFGGIYLAKNPERVQQEENWVTHKKAPILFKVKNIRPILYICQNDPSLNPYRVCLTLINLDSQFMSKGNMPLESISIEYFKDGSEYNRHAISPDDFIYLGQENINAVADYWHGLGIHRDVPDVLKRWEEVAIQKGYFTPSINPLYKSKKDKELTTAKDFFEVPIVVGDRVVYTLARYGRGLRVGIVTNITLENFVIDSSVVVPHECVIKYQKPGS